MGATDAGDRFGIRIDVGALQPLRVFRIQELLEARPSDCSIRLRRQQIFRR
jgi:hypothetical protein